MYIKGDNMDLIINFYKELDTLNLIIFWGIIIVIILLLIFSFILINKNKKLKKIVAQKNKTEEELPIIKEEIISEIQDEPETITIPISKELEHNKNFQTIETENNFVVEEHVLEYNQNKYNNTEPKIDDKTATEESTYESKSKQPIEIPSKPYQRNVLREMSLSQTSPIGINRQVPKEDKKMEMVKDLEESLNNEEKNITIEIKKDGYKSVDNQINEGVNKNNYNDSRKTDIKIDDKKIMTNTINDNKHINAPEAIELLNNQSTISDYIKEQNESEKYLEEVSRKLAEAEIPDEIERTNYELQQEEDAIISYKELMEKKDTIQTIDEEEAVISIEELMNKTNQKQEEQNNDTKLYNLSEEEANDNFIKELKQFRNDL